MRQQEIINGNYIPTVEEVRELEREYPYWIGPAIAAFRGSPSLAPEDEKYLRRRIGGAIGREEVIEDILGDLNIDFSGFYPDEQAPELTTDATIDAFIDKFGAKTGAGKVDELDAIMGASVDYAAMMEAEAMEAEKETDSDREDELLQPAEEEPRQNLSESFAKVMIRNGNYDKALQIFLKIRETENEKTPYLDDQIRFLEKLIQLRKGK